MNLRLTVYIISRLWFWELPCSGSAGSVSMPEALWRQTACGTCLYDFRHIFRLRASFLDTDRCDKSGKPTLVGASTGLVVGLVAITPGAGFVPVWSSFIIGFLVSPICYFGVALVKKKLKIDDALDAFGCHGIGGIWGGLATGIFADQSVNSAARWNGLVFGEYHLLLAQVAGILVTIAVAVVGTLICAAVVRIFTPLRVTQKRNRSAWIFPSMEKARIPALTV